MKVYVVLDGNGIHDVFSSMKKAKEYLELLFEEWRGYNRNVANLKWDDDREAFAFTDTSGDNEDLVMISEKEVR